MNRYPKELELLGIIGIGGLSTYLMAFPRDSRSLQFPQLLIVVGLIDLRFEFGVRLS
jgi:hypothetical protein